MLTTVELSPKEQEFALQTANYIKGLHPRETWNWVARRWRNDPNKTGLCLMVHYRMIGDHLAAFLTDNPDPLDYLDEAIFGEIKQSVRLQANYYIALWVLLFQGQRFIKKALNDAGYAMPAKRSVLLATIYAEEIITCSKILAGDFESLADAKHFDRIRTLEKELDETISPQMKAIIADRWKKEDSKLVLKPDKKHFQDGILWNWSIYQEVTAICMTALWENRRELPAWEFYVSAFKKWQMSSLGKVLVQKGIVKRYPGRKKSKDKSLAKNS